MNREILFRGKRIDNDEWVYGYVVRDEDGTTYIAGNSDAYIEVIPETVCQYTGLDDKNGVRIFEGDIVKNEEYILKVFYNPRQTKFALMGNEIFIDECSDTLSDCDDIDEKFVDNKYFEYKCGSYEVIGTIFDEREVK